MAVRARVQVCGSFVVTLDGRRVDPEIPGRQGRLLFGWHARSRCPATC